MDQIRVCVRNLRQSALQVFKCGDRPEPPAEIAATLDGRCLPTRYICISPDTTRQLHDLVRVLHQQQRPPTACVDLMGLVLARSLQQQHPGAGQQRSGFTRHDLFFGIDRHLIAVYDIDLGLAEEFGTCLAG